MNVFVDTYKNSIGCIDHLSFLIMIEYIDTTGNSIFKYKNYKSIVKNPSKEYYKPLRRIDL